MATRRALISVSDKTNLTPLCRALYEGGVELVSTGGTARFIKEAGFPVTLVKDVTGFPEILGGRVKTLHPKIHGGLLALPDDSDHQKDLQDLNIDLINFVIVNLYPFESTIAKKDISIEEAIEQIDIGGPTMLRSAAKNHKHVAVLTDPQDYDLFVKEFEQTQGQLSADFRAYLARKVFALTAHYDGVISTYLQKISNASESLPETLHLTYHKTQDLRYGENPHQSGAIYDLRGPGLTGIGKAQLLNGKSLSYNNLIDAEAAWNLAQEFESPACVVVKHANPCGCALASDSSEAFLKAWEGDPVSAFGSILAFNRPIDETTAQTIISGKRFVEVICAPEFSDPAVEVLSTRKGWGSNLRILKMDYHDSQQIQFRTLSGSLLAQETDHDEGAQFESLTREASEAEREDLKFAFKVVKHVKSNAIVIASEGQLLGVGAGQMNRVQSVELALNQAGDRAKGSVLASDAFFPFRDSIDVAARAGVKAVIQPGGSKKDPEVIEACEEHQMALIFTHQRHFRHG